MAYLDFRNRSPKVERLPDERLRVTRVADVLNFVPKDPAKLAAEILLPWGTPDIEYSNCLLIKQDVSGQVGVGTQPTPLPPQLVRVYEQINPEAETQVGGVDVTVNQYSYKEATFTYIQFSTGTPVYETPGGSVAPVPFSTCVLRDQEATDDGTLRTIKRTYVEGGQLDQIDELKFGGKLKLRTLKYLNVVPPTPSGYTLVNETIQWINGLKVYSYGFATAATGAGGGGVIDTQIEYGQSTDQGGTGTTKTTIKYISDPSVVVNPISTPSGQTLISIDQQINDGFTIWVGVYAKGTGLVVDESTIQVKDALVVYHRVALGTAPTAPSATIGGTVTLFEDSFRKADGYDIYERRWAEGNGQMSITTAGQGDGAIDYTVITNTAAAATPSYPGSGTAYLVRLTQEPKNGYFENTAVYRKPPATQTLLEMVDFQMPGTAEFVSNDLFISPPSTRTLLADVEVSYDTAQLSDTPFAVAFGCFLSESYIRTNNNDVGEGRRVSLGYVLGNASSVSGTNDFYNGILCDEFEAAISSSSPTARPSGATVIDVKHSVYLVDTSGTVVFRREKTSFTF